MSLPAKRGRPILFCVRTDRISDDDCGSMRKSAGRSRAFQFFFGRNAVEFLKHQKHRLIVNRDKSIVFAPEQRCMAVADLVADLCRLLFVTRSKGNADHLARRRIDGDDFFIVCIEHITLIQTPCENGIVHADAELRSVVGRLFMNLFEGFMPFDIDVFDRFSGSVKFRKFS